MDLQDSRLVLLFLIMFGIHGSAKADYILNMTYTAHVNLSTQHMPDGRNVYNGTNAIDGNYDTDIVKCLCCTHSRLDDPHPTLTIDLIGQYPIRRIVVYGRTDITDDTRKLDGSVTAYFDDSRVPTAYNISTNHLTVKPDVVDLTRIIQFKRENSDLKLYLIICEVEVIVFVCSDGSFGSDCLNECGSCRDNLACNKTNGHCVGGCNLGYEGEFCNITCSSGFYGYNCNGSCGNCKNNETCNRGNGTCELGCAAGYMRPNCQQKCTGNTFGENCIHECHCEGNKPCNIATGECPDGYCSLFYSGRNCSKDLNLLPHIKGNVSTSMTTPWTDDWTSDKAVDGVTKNANECHCCSATLIPISWWTLNLGQMYPIKFIQFYGRSEEEKFDQFKGFQLYLSNSTSTTQEPVYTNNASEPGYVFEIPVYDTLSQYIIIKKNNSLVVCEIKILEGVCPTGTFGDECSANCHCVDDRLCDGISGACQSPGCSPGWQGVACDEECRIGTFGDACSANCHCVDGKPCDEISGACQSPRCKLGWHGVACDEECADGTYGNCTAGCFCYGHDVCDKESGSCPGQCAAGYNGTQCNQRSDKNKDTDDGSQTGIVIGSAVAGIVFVILAAITVFLIRRGFIFPKTILKSTQHELTSFEDQPVEKSAEAKPATSNPNDKVDNEYYTFLPRKNDIKVHQLWDYIQQNMKNDCGSFYSQFKVLKRGLVHKHTVALKAKNKPRNRYNDTVAYDHSRVQLITTSPDGTDYINACFIDGFEKVSKFIASQGPTKNMVDDFWRMVWQQRSNKIVMLTNLIELGKQKCLQYWPDKGGKQFGKITVKLLKVDTCLDYVLRHLEVRQDSETPRTVTQYHLRAWPDKDVPDSAWCLVNFWRVVMKNSSTLDAGPIVVHCSAGVGRTGTFIALDNIYNQAVAEGCVRPQQMVETLRRQRVNMVQTQEQYVYLHEAVAEALLFGTHFVWSGQYSNMYQFLTETSTNSSLSRLEIQYNLINDSLMEPQIHQDSEAEYTNVTSLAAEIDAYRPHRKTTQSGYTKHLDALFLPDYKKQNAFLVANSPVEETVDQFWSLIVEQNVKTVIMLPAEMSQGRYKTSCCLESRCLGVGINFMHVACEVVTSEEEIAKYFTEREFKLTAKKTKIRKVLPVVKQFCYTAWGDRNNIPCDNQSMLEFLEAVHKWQSIATESQPILIHCGNGVKRSGIVCVLMNVLQRIRQDGGRINIVESVMTMKQRNKDIIQNLEQYRYCHDVILTHIKEPETKNTEIYQNLGQI